MINNQKIVGKQYFLSDDSEETTLEERQMAARTIEELIGPYLEKVR